MAAASIASSSGSPDPALKLNVTRDFTPVSNKTFVKINYTRAGQATAVIFQGV